MIKVGIVGGTGYTGVELLATARGAPRSRRPRDHVAQGRRYAGRRHVPEPARAILARVRRTCRSPPRFLRPGVLRHPARRGHGAGARAHGRGRQDHRPRRRLSPQGPGGLRPMVWHAAHLPRSSRRIGLRPARGEPRGHQDRAHRRQSGVLPHGRATGLPAVARGGNRRHRASRRRLQVRSFRRRPQGRDGLALRRGLRQLQGVQRQGPPAPSRRSSRD